MMLPAQPAWAHWTVKVFCRVRASIIRNWCLPRRKPSAYIAVTDPPCSFDADGRMRLHTLVRQFHPWYYPVPRCRSIYRRVVNTLGLPSRSLEPGPAFEARGYRIEELGPIRWEEDGYGRVFSDAAEMRGASIECPWSR
ncbi:hypothetical protein R3P38DRAFT_81565 [Favolaschia claudopus]|uniref:Uncharacterized protein n=1 Tax=Favolaschia claudopus TaxID=2862362 RepID=A0AAW0D6I1_9AGAR